MSNSITEYKVKNPENRWINQSGFSLFNIKIDGSKTWLHLSPQTSSIEIKDLDIHSDNFFIWVMNLSLIRIYNSVELLLLQSIQNKYFPNLKPITNNRKEINKTTAEIKNFLKLNNQPVDTTNNRYLIEFLKLKSQDFSKFLQKKVNKDWKNTWSEFFELFSILRNIVTHQAMIISHDNRNSLNSVAKDIFNHYFVQPIDTKDAEILKPKDEQYFLNFVRQVNDFAANTIKFIADENDFVFIGLHKA